MDDTEFQTLLRQIACQFILAPEAADALLRRILEILFGSRFDNESS